MDILHFCCLENFFIGGLSAPGSMMLNVVVVTVVAYIIYKVIVSIIRFQNLRSMFRNLPGPGPEDTHWLYGNLHLFPRDGEEHRKWLLEICHKYPRFFLLWRGPFQPSILVHHPSTVQTILKTSEPKPTGFSGIYRFAIPWLGEGLLIAQGARWARSRRLLTPAFHFDILKPYVSVYNDAVKILLEKLAAAADTGDNFEVFQSISMCTLDIIMRCAFSYHSDFQRSETAHPYVKAVREITAEIFNRARKPYLYPDCIYFCTKLGRKFQENCNYVHGLAEDVIKKRREGLEKEGVSNRKYLDFLDILLTAKDETGVGLTPIEIRNEVDTFMFEGHDTTASAISWILYALAKYPEIQEKVHREVDEILGDRETDDLHWNDFARLEYLTMVIKEGLRYYSPVPSFSRQFTRDFELDGRHFPAGTHVGILNYALHHNEDVWTDHMEFIPERFSKDNLDKMDPFQFVPFSAGPRNCIGQHFATNEEKVVVARIVHRFKLELVPDHQPKINLTTLVTSSDNGILLRIYKR